MCTLQSLQVAVFLYCVCHVVVVVVDSMDPQDPIFKSVLTSEWLNDNNIYIYIYIYRRLGASVVVY